MGIFDRLDRLADQLGDLILPDDVRAHVELGAAYLERGDLDAAAAELERAVALRPEHPRALYLLGMAHARRGEDELAAAALTKAATVRGGFAEAYVALGEVHRRRGDRQQANDAFRSALDAGLADGQLRGEVYRGLGALYLSEHRLDKAVRELRKAVASLPEDAEAQALLGRALLLRGDLDAARISLERATQAQGADPSALVALGDVYTRQGRIDEARALLERAAVSDEPETQVGARLHLARLARLSGDLPRAQLEIARALDHGADRPDLLVERARILACGGATEEALAAFDRALVGGSAVGPQRLLFDRRPVLEEALQVAARAGLVARAVLYARALLDGDSGEGAGPPDALAALALDALANGDLDGAQRLVDRAGSGDTVALRLAVAELAASRAQPAAAASALRRAAQLDPSDPRPRLRLTQLYRAEREAIPQDLYSLLTLAHRHFSRTRELAELSPEAGRLVETLDRPLLVTVMGEFNSGKSTFVNALLGEEVAPMGITPTTAAIHVLKYGVERKGRVVYLDDTARDVAWAEVPALLRGLDATEARRIRLVEVLYPLAALERVNVVDTPGLNSIHPEHEAIAQRFIAESDAVVWLFTVDQAGKASEGAALAKIRGEGKKILGVLNKIDRCAPEELQKIVEHVRASFGEGLETVVPLSAKEALAALRTGDPAQLGASNYAALQHTLEERFFSRARFIQREAARTRLKLLLDRAREIGLALVDQVRSQSLDAALAQGRTDRESFIRDFLVRERQQLADGAEAALAACAREVLDFARPRRWAFGSNQAAPADRDFLLGLLEERLAALLEASRARVAAEAERALAPVAVLLGELDSRLELRLLDEQVYGRFRAFARGYLRGGRVDDFFTRVLPKLELTEREIRRALERDATPYTAEIMEAELRAPLLSWGDRFHAALAARVERARAAVELDRFDVEERLLAPIEILRGALDTVNG